MIFLVSIRDIMAGMRRREEMMISEGILPGGVPSIERYERGKRGRGRGGKGKRKGEVKCSEGWRSKKKRIDRS